MCRKCYDIPSLPESLAMDVVRGKMTMEEAACELCMNNHTPFVDVERAEKILAPYIEKINAVKGDKS